LERLMEADEVTQADLETAAEALEAGRLSQEEFEQVLSAWLARSKPLDEENGEW
jgi:hypothetical protein